MAESPSTGSLIERFDPQVLAALSGLDLKARYVVEGFLHGLHKSPFHGISVEFSEYRDYQKGDDLRHLDWRLYARCDKLCVKKYTQETNVRIYLVVDTSGSMAYRGASAWGSKLDVARVLAAALTSMMLNQNDAVGLLAIESGDAGAQFIRPSQKPSQFGILLQQLERLTASGGPQLGPLLDHANRLLHRRSLLLFFSDLLEPAEHIRTAFQQLRFQGHECLILQVLDRDEIEFPFDASTVFEDLESTRRRSVDPAAARSRYLERFERFMEEHRQMFRGLEMPHSLTRTDGDPWQALSTFIQRRQRMP